MGQIFSRNFQSSYFNDFKVKDLERRITTESLKNSIPFLMKLGKLRSNVFRRKNRRARGFDFDIDPVKFFFDAYKKEEAMLKLRERQEPAPTESPEEFLDMLGGMKDNAPQLNLHGKVPQRFLPAGYDKFSASDIQWQAQHMSAAAACRGISKGKGHPGLHNVVLLRNAREGKTCRQLCATSWANRCEGEVSLWGAVGKGKRNGQEVGNYYNYGCDYGYNGGNEAFARSDAISKEYREGHHYFFSYCCCSFY